MKLFWAVFKQDLESPLLFGISYPLYNFNSKPCPKQEKYRARMGFDKIIKEQTYISIDVYFFKWQFLAELTLSRCVYESR